MDKTDMIICDAMSALIRYSQISFNDTEKAIEQTDEIYNKLKELVNENIADHFHIIALTTLYHRV